MAFCLLDAQAQKFREALKDGTINPDKMSKMTSEERRSFLAGIVGEANAKAVNALFESKMLLKNQKRGMITWATKVAKLSPEARRNILDKIERLDKALSPAEQELFLADIIEQRLGVQVDIQDAQIITQLTEKMDAEWQKAANRVGEEATDEQIKEVLRNDPEKTYYRTSQELNEFLRDKVPGRRTTGFFGRGLQAISEGASIARAVRTAWDVSAILRQGASFMGRKQWFGAVSRTFGYVKSKKAIDELEVSMMSHKYTDEAMKVKRDLGLTLLGETFTQREEQFASKYIRNVPGLKESERAYVGFLNDLRFNRFVDVLENLERAGKDITDDPKAMKDLAQTIGAATGRGSLGSWEGAARPLATVLFSPRWFASRFQVVAYPFTKRGPAQIEAAKNLGTIVATTTTLMGLAALAGFDVEFDPRSPDFGQVKIGRVRFNLTGGMGPYMRIVVQAALLSTKSSTTGKITKLNTGDFGGRTVFDLLVQFIGNKASPVAGIIRDVFKGEGFGGEEIDAGYVARQLIVPLILETTIDAYNDSGGSIGVTVAAATAEFFGIGVNSYGYVPGGATWEQLREDRGDKEYEKAIRALNDAIEPRLKEVHKNDTFRGYTIEEQNKVINAMIDEEEEKILRPYHIKVTKEKTTSTKRLLQKVR